jgi:hypothetical protein
MKIADLSCRTIFFGNVSLKTIMQKIGCLVGTIKQETNCDATDMHHLIVQLNSYLV